MLPSQYLDQMQRDTRAAGANRMAETYTTTVDVQTRAVDGRKGRSRLKCVMQ